MLHFANAIFLAGLAAMAIPVVIHFLTRARPRTIRLPTFHLLVEAGSGRQSLNRLRTFLILLFRGLLVAAIVLMFAQPFLQQVETVQTDDDTRRVVLVVDASMSMRAADGPVTVFSNARAQAADVLRSLEPGSSASVIFIGNEPQPVLPALSRNLNALHDGLMQINATYERGNPEQALALADRMLEGNGEVFVFSDFQRTNWASVDFAHYSDLRIYLKPVVEVPIDNVGITHIAMSPAEPAVGENIELNVTLFNASGNNNIQTVKLDIEGVTQSAEAQLKPYASATVTFSFNLPAAGWMPGRVTIDADNLIDDNTRYVKIRVRDTLRVLVLCDEDENDVTSAAFYLSKAISPSEFAGTAIDVARRMTQAVDRGALETADVFFIVSPATLSGEAAEVIARRVSDGAQLFCLLGDQHGPDMVSLLHGSSQGAISPPFTIRRWVDHPGEGEPFASAQTRSGPLRAFASPEDADLNAFRFAGHFLTDDLSGRGEEIIARYADGAAGLSLSPAGRGSVAFANFPVKPLLSNIAGSPLFPAMIHELLRSMRQSEDAALTTPGGQWTIDVSLPAETNDTDDMNAFVVLSPDAQEMPNTILSRGRTMKLSIHNAPMPGLYEIRSADRAIDVGVVNVDAAEVDTRALAPQQLLNAAGGASVTVVTADRELQRIGQATVLWPWFAALAALFLCVEMLLLSMWRRQPRSSTEPQPQSAQIRRTS